MLNGIEQVREKNRPVYDFIFELLMQSIEADEIAREAGKNVLSYLIAEGKKKGYEAIDLTGMFRFVFYGEYYAVIPRIRFDLNDSLVLRNPGPGAAPAAELIEFDPASCEVNPDNLPRFLRSYLKPRKMMSVDK